MTNLAADEGEVLDTGCLAHTPHGDNLLLDYARGEADAFGTAAAAGGGRVQDVAELGLHLADLSVGTPFGNTAHLVRPVDHASIPALAAALHDFFDATPGGPFLVFSPWPIGDLGAHGFHLVGHPPLMVRAPTVPKRATNPALRIEAVTTAEGLVEYERTLVEAYPAPEMQPFAGLRLLHADLLASKWQFFAGYDGDRCVATAAAWLHDSVTIIEQVSVRDECRGNGYGTAITAAATHAVPAERVRDRPDEHGEPPSRDEQARDLGNRTAMLIASDLGRPIYDQLGYLTLLRYTLYIGMRG